MIVAEEIAKLEIAKVGGTKVGGTKVGGTKVGRTKEIGGKGVIMKKTQSIMTNLTAISKMNLTKN